MPQHPIRNFILLGKKDETFTQQLLQSAVAIAALHLILELLTKVLSLSLSLIFLSCCWPQSILRTVLQRLAIVILLLHLVQEVFVPTHNGSQTRDDGVQGVSARHEHPSDGIIATASGCCQQHCRKVYEPVGLCIPQPSPSASPPWRLELRLWVSRLAALPRAEVET